MSLISKVITSEVVDPPKMIIYGEPGVGKTTLAAEAGALVIDCEKGAGAIKGLHRTPMLNSWNEIREWLIELASNGADYKVVAIDTVDWLVRRIIEHVVQNLDGDPSMTNTLGKSHGGYQKGREVVENIVYCELFPMLNAINDRGIALILLAHASYEEGKDAEGLDRKGAVPDIPKWIRPPFVEWADAVLFVRSDHTVITQCTNLALAKNRYQMKAEMPQSWPAIQAATTLPTTEATING